MSITRRTLISFMLAAFALAAPAVAHAASKGWEQVKSEHRDAKSVAKEAEIEIMTAPSMIIINTNHQVQIKVFTILGRLVSSETIQPGISQLTVGAHGVYIIKVGELTCKVAI